MLIHLENEAEKNLAQIELEKSVKASLQEIGIQKIGFRSDTMQKPMFAGGEGALWAAFYKADDAAIPRSWNGFGIYERDRSSQIITVEINIPTGSNSAQVAGFYARDPESGAVYLMHDGGVGGGMKGVSKSEFLAWTGRELRQVSRSSGIARDGIVIGRINSADLPQRILKYVVEVAEFKKAVRDGDLNNDVMRLKAKEWDDYRKEATGQRKGQRSSDIDYISYHGDVVDFFKLHRETVKASGEKVTNSPLVDLLVIKNEYITEIYEVKTNIGRQTLYTAIGQLMTHCPRDIPETKRFLVIPVGDLPKDLESCFANLGIELLRFQLTNGKNKQVVLC